MKAPAIQAIASARMPTVATTARHGDFAVLPEADPGIPVSGRAATGIGTASVGACVLLALQEGMETETGDREVRQHGQRLLTALRDLQRGLLGADAEGALARLQLLIETIPDAADPRLASAIGSIRLRARIEVAKAAAGSGER